MKRLKLILTGTLLAALVSCKKNEKIIQETEKQLVVSTFVGANGQAYIDGTGTSAAFNFPRSLAIDGSGNIFITDPGNVRIRKINPSGVVTTFAGNGVSGYADGVATAAQFGDGDNFIAIDNKDNLYITDTRNNCIRKVTPSGVTTTYAGIPGSSGSVDGPVATAKFSALQGLAIDASNNIYVADGSGIRKITSSGIVTTLIKSGSSTINGPIETGLILPPEDIAVDATGILYFTVHNASFSRQSIQKITPDGIMTTFAGAFKGYINGPGPVAAFNMRGLGVDLAGNIYIADTNNQCIRKITPDGTVRLFAGIQNSDVNTSIDIDGLATEAKFKDPQDLIFDAKGSIYVLERAGGVIRKISLVDIALPPITQDEFDKKNWNKPTGWK